MTNRELKDGIVNDLRAINSHLKENGEAKHELKVLYDVAEDVYFIDDHNTRRSKATDLVTIATMIAELRELLIEDRAPLRICSVCGEIIFWSAYVEDYGGVCDYYCSNDCLHTKYTDEEWERECDEYPNETYYTEYI